MKKILLSIITCLFAAVSLAAPNELKPPSADQVDRMEKAAPSKATAQPSKPRKVLIINQCEGFPHSSIPCGAKAFEIMGRKTGAFTAVAVDDFSILEKPEFDTFDLIIMNNTTVRLPLLNIDDEAREAVAQKRFLDFVRNGKGLVGVHAATDCLYKWPEYGELIGGFFSGHPWSEDVRIKLDDPGHPLLAAFNGQDFNVGDEIYQFRDPYSREKLRVLLSLDVEKINMDKKGIQREDKDFAVAWIHEYGKGRMFYFSLGHREEIFWNPQVMQCYLDGIQYALGDLPMDATPSAQLTDTYLEQSRAAGFSVGMKNMISQLSQYTLSGDTGIAKQIDAFVDKHMSDSRANCDALSKGLASVVANPQATIDSRALACRKLSLAGTDNAVPTLAKFIGDKELGNWARYALALIPGSAADNALVDALKTTNGEDRLAVAALVGQRRVASGVESLAKLVTSDDAVAVVAAEALGRIGSTDAVNTLAKLQSKVNGTVRLAVDRALLDAGESARLANNNSAAAKIYGRLASDSTAPHVRAAAMYGKNMSAGDEGLNAAVDALKGTENELSRAGARLVRDLPDKKIIPGITAALKDMPPASQVLALDALAARGDRAAQDAALAMVASENPDVRAAALRALEQLGDRRAVKTVIAVASSQDVDQLSRETARTTLYTMNGPGVDDAIAEALRSADVNTKIEYVKVLGVRKGRSAMNDLLTAARDNDAALAKESRKSIGMIALAEDLPGIVTLLTETTDSGALTQLENIIVKASDSTDDETLKTAAALKALGKKIPVEARCSLFAALGKIGAESGLPAVKTAFKDNDVSVRRAAIKAVSEYWPNAAPVMELRDISRDDQDETCRVLALRGYARMLAMPSKRPMQETLKLYKEALDMAKGTQEKRALISGLGQLTHPNALEFVKPFLQDENVRSEALLAAVSITEGLNGNAMVLKGSVQQGSERNALDGNPKTRWTTGAAMRGGEWFIVDLGYEDNIREIYIDAGPEGSDQPRGYEIYLSLDGENWGEPATKGDDPKKKAFTIAMSEKYGRFIKIVQKGTSGGFWSINEIRINGLPDLNGKEPLDRAKWKVSSSRAGGDSGPENAIDGDLSKRWGTGGAMQPNDWFAVDLGEEKTVHAVIMNAAGSGNDYPRECQVYTSMDGENWYGPVGACKGDGAVTKVTLLPTKARHVKIVQTGSHETNWWSMYDLQIHGE